MRILMIGVEERKKLAAIKEYAEKNPYTVDVLKQIGKGVMTPAGQDKNLMCVIPDGYKVSLSIEIQEKLKARHLSMSVPEPGRLPNVAACNLLMPDLGFKSIIGDSELVIWMEDIGPGHQAINIIEIIEVFQQA